MGEIQDGSFEGGKAGVERGPMVGGGFGSVWGTGAELGETSDAGCSPLGAIQVGAKMSDAYRGDSDRPTVRTSAAAATVVCSKSPSWAELSVDGDGETQRDVRTGGSRIRFRFVWAPGSGRRGSRGADGWTEAETGSRRGSWSEQLGAGVGGEGAAGRGAA